MQTSHYVDDIISSCNTKKVPLSITQVPEPSYKMQSLISEAEPLTPTHSWGFQRLGSILQWCQHLRFAMEYPHWQPLIDTASRGPVWIFSDILSLQAYISYHNKEKDLHTTSVAAMTVLAWTTTPKWSRWVVDSHQGDRRDHINIHFQILFLQIRMTNHTTNSTYFQMLAQSPTWLWPSSAMNLVPVLYKGSTVEAADTT